MIIASSKELAEQAIDIDAGKGETVDSLADIFVVHPGVPIGSTVILAARGLSGAPDIHPKAAVLKQIDEINIMSGEAAGAAYLNISAKTQTPELATQILQMIQGMQVFAVLTHQQEHPKLADLINAVKITAADNKVQVNFSYPSEKLVELMKKLHQMKKDGKLNMHHN